IPQILCLGGRAGDNRAAGIVQDGPDIDRALEVWQAMPLDVTEVDAPPAMGKTRREGHPLLGLRGRGRQEPDAVQVAVLGEGAATGARTQLDVVPLLESGRHAEFPDS